MHNLLIGGLKKALKPFVPEPLKERFRIFQRRFRSTESVFTEIYQKKKWGNRESTDLYSGPGSRGLVAEQYIETVTRFIADNNIASVVDLGCGDFVIGRSVADAVSHYTGVDVVKLVVDHHIEQFGSDRVTFRHLDIARDTLPDGELCLIRQVLQHLSNEQILQILPKLGKFRHVIITEHYPAHKNVVARNLNKQHGSDTRLRSGSAVYLDSPPFNVKSCELLLDVPLDERAANEADCEAGFIRSYLIEV